MDNNEYIAGFTMKPESEIDDDNFEKQIMDAENNYDGYNMIDAFDDDNFETIFKLNYHNILSFPPSDIIVICSMFVNKIKNSFNYQFTPILIFDNMTSVIEFFDFVKFIKFNNVSFLKKLCLELGMSLNDIVKNKDLVNVKPTYMINVADNIADHYKYNKLIYNFITTHNRGDLINWIQDQYIKNRSEILLELI